MNQLLITNNYASAILTSDSEQVSDRQQILAGFASQKINFLCVVDILNEGVDIPNINNVIFARPTNSTTIFLQQLGRGLRKQSDKVLNVFDLVANINSPNYWYLRLNQLTKLTPNMTSYGYDILELDNVCLIYDKLSYQEVVGSLEKKWAKTYQLNLTQYDIKKTKAKDELTKDEVILYYLFNNKNLSHQWCGVIGSYLNKPNTFIDEKTLNQMDLTSWEKDFQGVRFTRFMDKYKDVEQLGLEDMVKLVKHEIGKNKTKTNSLLYNYGSQVLGGDSLIKNDSVMFKLIQGKFLAKAVKKDGNYILMSGSHFKPRGRENYNSEDEKLWDKYCQNIEDRVSQNPDIYQIKKDIVFFDPSKMCRFVVGGDSGFNEEFFLENPKIKIRNYICQLIKSEIEKYS
ncbi:DEAD/DEAH box helicase [Spiroplasma alleghenense]|uniref:DEAD/DEAH box helicase n=1 Tax=Spiroplasma alleghenense TaxID=216931 RepID=UPI00319DB199